MQSPFTVLIILLALLGMESKSIHASEPLQLMIESGGHDRHQAIVPVPIPGALPERPALIDVEGNVLPLQVWNETQLVFILPHLAAGESMQYEVISLAGEVEDPARATVVDGTVQLSVHGRPVTRYFSEPSPLPRADLDPVYKRGGYLYPVWTPEGRAVTDDFPEKHAHHHSIWMAWTRTSFAGRSPDFWNMGKGEALVEVAGLGDTWSGPVHAGLRSQHHYVDLSGDEKEIALQEEWTVRVFSVEDKEFSYHLVDLHAVQVTAGEEALMLPRYHYGGLGVRGASQWDGADMAVILNSEGESDRVAANSSPARWIFMGGDIDGHMAGIAMLSHPDNFRAPQSVRVHPDEPFMCFAPQIDGAMSIEPGEVYTAHYRFVIADGEARPELIERLWNDFAEPAKATWQE